MVRRDGHSEDFDSVLLGFVGGLLHATAWLLVPGDGVAIGHHHNVLVLVVVGAPAGTQTQQHPNVYSTVKGFTQVRVCVLVVPNEQFSEAPLDGAVGVGALADVFDGVDAIFQLLAVSRHVTQLPYQDHFVTVVKGSRVPRQDAVASVASGQAQVSISTHAHSIST